MPAPKNHLKVALAAKRPQYGLWLNLASAYSAEALAGAGYDWLLIDGEHGPNAIPDMLAQAQTIGTRCNVVVRPPAGEGRGGVGGAVARASDFGRITDYLTTANAETCLILQLESRAGLAALPAILEMEGVDGVFIGPSDLAADMGFPGNTAAPEVQSAIDTALRAIIASGKSAGILTFDPAAAARYRDMGVTFIGVGGDIAILVKGAAALVQKVRES